MRTVIIMGSGPGVLAAAAMPKGDAHLVAINNAWQVRPDWDALIHPEDFPVDRRPTSLHPGQSVVTSAEYVPLQNALGGFVYAGGTMAFTAAYWALRALHPKVIAMVGCDMVYPASGPTHFYGTGTPDPLRDDITLRSLEAKSARFMVLAARAGCAVVNLSNAPESRLIYPRTTRDALPNQHPMAFDARLTEAALHREAELGYVVPSGKYWKEADRFDPAEIDRVDAMWLRAAGFRSSLRAGTALSDPPRAAHRNG
ncbi:MAG: hypothetical protein U0934_16005 [Pseudotabrizicola sp.]|uniref:hypothetical protein n=1 Tax=Pseudotabrizicola sp. TaxID=2939647 RepID=UPI00271E5C1B|nr:hypothetical protein [Pseudotabrizicola sp.]MDO8883555.1 hypothetical protein [Pseudotabrizicola sp.]MDP2079987.1 hypothetical protein [Pseudotabrizicola sp.]MDZ7575432.1 hypothetical protein [Pseudotabrizicola sp.]